MSGSILTLFGEEIVPEEQKSAAKTRGRKKSAKEEANEELTPAEPEAIAETIVEPAAPVLLDLFGQPIITEPALPVTAPEPAPAAAATAIPAKRTRKKTSEETILDPTVFAEASLFDLFSGPQDLGKIAAEIQHHAAPAPEVSAPEIVAAVPEPAIVEAIMETPVVEAIPEPAQEIAMPETAAVISESALEKARVEIQEVETAEPTQEVIAPEMVVVTPVAARVEAISEIHTVEIVPEPVAMEAEVPVVAEVVAEITEEIIVAAEEPAIAEIPVAAVLSETHDIPTEVPEIIAQDVQAEIEATTEALEPTIQEVVIAPAEDVNIEIVATEPEVLMAPIEEAAARIEVIPTEMAMPELVTEVVEPAAAPVMEMVAPATAVVVTKKKRTRKVVEAVEAETETADPALSNNLPMDWQGHKTYYTIGEVAALFKVKTSNIRFWTNEFKLKVRTTRKGDRLYTPELVKEVRTIYHLVKERGFTLAGAKARLKTQNRKDVETVDLKHSLQQLRNQLVTIKNQLQ